ncbi:Cytochrome c-556 [Rhodovulum sp. P5]|uniref:c-type cytochrome n=1 Tax=Rhodovulum sp. P5 TaxID=1564506 RepID=UPI0009C1D033|nr:cytochrome c [Rhodovulum sp. P5]ARE41476.1 Cytochrome c-556 [Rhodovulum sp. P5]
MTLKRISQLTVFSLVAAAATLSYAADATEPTVKARQELMEKIGMNTKLISQMAKGEKPFDASAAQQAVATIAEKAGETPAAFKTQADDPESTAKANIWEDFDDFTAKSEALHKAAMAADVSSLDALRAALPEIGKTCKSCHDDYRTKD